MPFPEKPRVLYNKNPLGQVVCQLRFPAILRIDTEIPSKFQEKIQRVFPGYSEKVQTRFEIPDDIRESIPPAVLSQPLQGVDSSKNYSFRSEDDMWTINLTRSFLALSTTKYERWEDFKEKLSVPFEALAEIYSPAYFSRVGLRYIDVIKRSELELDGVEWAELLNPAIAGMLSSEVAGSVENFESAYEIRLSDGISYVRMFTKFVDSNGERELSYMIDNDFFCRERIESKDVEAKLDFFNVRSSWCFQWCISDKLHKAMEPENI